MLLSSPQTFAISIIIVFDRGFTLSEIVYSTATFFLAPFLYISAKRFVGLNIRTLLKKYNDWFEFSDEIFKSEKYISII